MSEAFEAALKELQDSGQPEGMREVVANRIVAAARFGERDPARLLEAAIGKSRGEQNGFVASAPHQVETCLKLGARNAIAGTVIDVTMGQTTAHVQIDIGGGQIITASITNECRDQGIGCHDRDRLRRFADDTRAVAQNEPRARSWHSRASD